VSQPSSAVPQPSSAVPQPDTDADADTHPTSDVAARSQPGPPAYATGTEPHAEARAAA
jgi:hypothetical protein